jgi:tetratricopeptide (TPR) repeat protein
VDRISYCNLLNDQDKNSAENAGTAGELQPETPDAIASLEQASAASTAGSESGEGLPADASSSHGSDSQVGSEIDEITQIIAQAARAFANVQVAQAGQHYERALFLFERSGIKDGAQFRDCLRNLCDIYMVLDKPKQALKTITALRKVDDSPANKTNHLAILLHLGNRLEAEEKRYEEAETIYKTAVELAKPWLSYTDPMIERLNKAAIQAHKKVVATGGYEPVDADALPASAAGLSAALGVRHTGAHKLTRSGSTSLPNLPAQQSEASRFTGKDKKEDRTAQGGSPDGSAKWSAAPVGAYAASRSGQKSGAERSAQHGEEATEEAGRALNHAKPADLNSAVQARSDSSTNANEPPGVSPFQWILILTSVILLLCAIVLAIGQFQHH